MKSLSATTLLFCLVAIAGAQQSASSTAPADVLVIKKSWQRVVHHPGLDADPFEANDRSREMARNQHIANHENGSRRNQGRAIQPQNPRPKVFKNTPNGYNAAFDYKVTLRNVGKKPIQFIAWEYIFTDPETKTEISRHELEGKIQLEPGKSKEMIGRTNRPPSITVGAEQAEKGKENQFIEEVIITRIEYADGTVWQRPPQ